MQDFDLIIEQEGTIHTVRAEIEGAEATQPFTFPFAEMQLENLLLRIGTGHQGVWRRAGDAPELQAAKEFGGILFEAVFTGSVRDLLRRAQNEYPALRLRLTFNQAPLLANLPWEFLYDREDNLFLALSNASPIVRYLEQSRRVPPLSVAAPLRLLVVIATPVDLEQTDADLEWENLQTVLAPLVQRGTLQIDRLTPPTFAALQAALRRTPYHLLHFIGHGDFDSSVQDGVLFLEDDLRHSRRTNGQSLGFLLRDYRDTLRFVFLNVCEGSKTALNDPFAGVAQSLIQQGIPAVLAMQSAVRDDYALSVARTFYATLTENVSLEIALTEARRTLFAETQRVEWGIPVLYTRAHEGTLFRIAEPHVAPVFKEPTTEIRPDSEPIDKANPTDTPEPIHQSPQPPAFQETVSPLQQKLTTFAEKSTKGGSDRTRWTIGIGIVSILLLLFWASGRFTQLQSLLSTVAGAPTDQQPASNRTALTENLLYAAQDDHTLESVTQALVADGYLNEGHVWDYFNDLTGDGREDWVLQTSRDTNGCSSLIIVEPNTPELLHDSYAYVGDEASVTLLALSDVTGDGIDDVLYQITPCSGSTTFNSSEYRLWSLTGNLQSSYTVAYLKLLQANDLFAMGSYNEASVLYNEIFSPTPGSRTGWKYDEYEEVNAIQKFAGARLIVISLMETGNDGGYLAEFQSTVDINDPYQLPLKEMVENVARGNDMSAACNAFREQVDQPNRLTFPLDQMGSIVLKVDDICPF